LDRRHQLNDLVVEAEQVAFQLALVFNELQTGRGLAESAQIDVVGYQKELVAGLVGARGPARVQLALELQEELHDLGEEVGDARVVADLLGKIKLRINSNVNCVLVSVFSYLFKNKTIEDKSESEVL
jgi:hypothetical protein